MNDWFDDPNDVSDIQTDPHSAIGEPNYQKTKYGVWPGLDRRFHLHSGLRTIIFPNDPTLK